MNKQEQIREMAIILYKKMILDANEYEKDCFTKYAEALYMEDYRKVPDGAIVFTKEEQEKHIIMTKVNYKNIMGQLNQARKETAKEILTAIGNITVGGLMTKLKYDMDFRNICTKYGVEVE